MIRRYPVIAYFALAYLITWAIRIRGILFAHDHGVEISNEDNFNVFVDLFGGDATRDQRLSLAIFNAGQFGPMIAAFLLAAALYGRPGVRDLLLRTVRWRTDARWYVVVVLLPVFISGVALFVALLAGGFTIGPFEPDVRWGLLPAFFLYSLVFNGLAEEPGWRGFALPHVQAQRSAYGASWVVGIGWGPGICRSRSTTTGRSLP